MATFSYKLKKQLSMGNRKAYLYTLTNVQTDSTSIVYTSFKKITGYLIQTNTNATSSIVVESNTPSSGKSKCAYLTLDSGAEASGEILIVGLL